MILKSLNCPETEQQLTLSKNLNSDPVTYEVNDVNIILCNIQPENCELSEGCKIVKNFDSRLVYDIPLSPDSDISAKIFLEVDRVEVETDKKQLTDLIELSQVFKEDLERISGLASQTRNEPVAELRRSQCQSEYREVSMRGSLVVGHDVSRKWKGDGLEFGPREESKLIDELSSEDDQFYDAFDKIDDHDKNLYKQIQSKRRSIGSENEPESNTKSVNVSKTQRKKIIIISEMRG